MKTNKLLLTVCCLALLALNSITGAQVRKIGVFTGNYWKVETRSRKVVLRCEYKYNRNLFYELVDSTSCPQTIELR